MSLTANRTWPRWSSSPARRATTTWFEFEVGLDALWEGFEQLLERRSAASWSWRACGVA